MNKKIVNKLIILIFIPILIAIGIIVFKDRKYNIISMLIAVFACVPLFIRFEKNDIDVKNLIIIAVMTALSAAGRFAFAAIPGFKPVTAVVVITAMYFGSDSGFVTGALSAIVSNIFFGQGPWTPFQMFSWGMVGYIAGILTEKKLLENRLVLFFYGVIAGVLYSIIMDVWTVLSMDGTFNLTRYIAAVISAVPFTLTYAVSNVVFLFFLEKPIGEKLLRIKKKYQI